MTPRFIGWMAFEDIRTALFNIKVEGSRFEATYSPATLRSMGIEVPEYPTFEEWMKGRKS